MVLEERADLGCVTAFSVLRHEGGKPGVAVARDDDVGGRAGGALPCTTTLLPSAPTVK